ncbi:hypothetical protein KIN20_008359 [Parelaphostrongylus tenuis]|uniref:Uncharacterized protein n=1 Tax=Parelaphostrongylus tenuis TaxID=148309 RepID=A0AAD5MWQ0_PARTN|nr:hypothetical protein KIN20_008359 [Parelaphostrongylus tenuis]
MEEKVSATCYTKAEALKTALTSAWDEFAVKTCANIVGNVHQRLRKYIGARGDESFLPQHKPLLMKHDEILRDLD